jgi:hypothetical protein
VLAEGGDNRRAGDEEGGDALYHHRVVRRDGTSCAKAHDWTEERTSNWDLREHLHLMLEPQQGRNIIVPQLEDGRNGAAA